MNEEAANDSAYWNDKYADDDCLDEDGNFYPEHDVPEGYTNCRRCDAEIDEEEDE